MSEFADGVQDILKRYHIRTIRLESNTRNYIIIYKETNGILI